MCFFDIILKILFFSTFFFFLRLFVDFWRREIFSEEENNAETKKTKSTIEYFLLAHCHWISLTNEEWEFNEDGEVEGGRENE